jgi:hypothetical protein
MALTLVPVSGQNLSQTRDPIRLNFNTLNSTWIVDHVDWGPTGPNLNAGKHNKVTYFQQASDPATGATEIDIYSKQSTFSGITELFLRKANSGTITEFTFLNNYWTRLPSGLLLKWFIDTNTVIAPGITTNNYTWPLIDGSGKPIPSFTQAPYYFSITNASGTSNNSCSYSLLYDASFTATTFTVIIVGPLYPGTVKNFTGLYFALGI